jgi:hypothetical protein
MKGWCLGPAVLTLIVNVAVLPLVTGAAARLCGAGMFLPRLPSVACARNRAWRLNDIVGTLTAAAAGLDTRSATRENILTVCRLTDYDGVLLRSLGAS